MKLNIFVAFCSDLLDDTINGGLWEYNTDQLNNRTRSNGTVAKYICNVGLSPLGGILTCDTVNGRGIIQCAQ